MKIKVVDAMMGSGKTKAAINKMKQDDGNNYVFVTPYLKEIERIKHECDGCKKFYDPFNTGNGKLSNLHKLLTEGKNVATTHALFKQWDTITLELLQAGDYILILDEVVDLVDKINLTPKDIAMITENFTEQQNEYLLWKEDCRDYDGRFSDIMNMSKNRSIISKDETYLFWVLSPKIFTAFKEVYVLTYMFRGQLQKYYFDWHNLKYEFYIPNNEMTDYVLNEGSSDNLEYKQKIKSLVSLVDNDKINNIGEKEFSLSKGWFEKQNNKELVEKLKNNLVNFFINRTKSKSAQNMWTTYKSERSKLTGNGYSRGFVSCNARATNMYQEKDCAAYVLNVFMNPIIKNFFIERGIDVDEEVYALSDLVQWVWRSGIRNEKPIKLYIPSARMRNLFKQWLDTEDIIET